tara:strand:- start:342 stop:1199 length:858 start_codon:yes stop_codon:yes gene_type:complete
MTINQNIFGNKPPEAAELEPETSTSKDLNLAAFSTAPDGVKTDINLELFGGGTAPSRKQPKDGLIKSWSPSSLKKFETCAYAAFLNYVKKIYQPGNEFTERGTQIHQEAEDFVRGIGELTQNLMAFANQFHALRKAYEEGRVILEEEWGFDQNWNPTSWKDAWVRMKLDALELESETSAVITDYKTGKKDGNEVAHSSQGMIYAIGTFAKYPNLQYLRVNFWYLDQGQAMEKVYRRSEMAIFQPRVTARGMKMTTCTEFNPSPSRKNCMYCFYYDNGDCDYGTRI